MFQEDSDLPDVDRRTLMKIAGTAGAAGLAGCTELTGDGDTGGGTPTEAAQQMLKQGFEEAGYEKPFKTKIITNQNPQRVQWCELIQEAMNQTGYFDVSLEQFEFNTYVSKILAEDSHKQNQIVAVGWSAGWDPDAYVHNLFHKEQFTPACCNINHYSREKVNNLIDEGLTTYDIAERKSIYEDLQREIVSDSPMSFIRFGKRQDAWIADRVHNFETYPIDGSEYAGIYAPYAGKYTWVGSGDSVQMGGELVATFGADVKNFDPTRANDTTSTKAFDLVYEPLIGVDFEGKPQPYVAESVTKQSDTEFQITLKEGVTFHNGTELTADDVKATFERYKGTPRESDVYNWYKSSEIAGDYTLNLTLSRPYAPLKFSLAGVPIVPKAVADGDIDLSENPVGSGPYKFVKHEPDELFRLRRNENHWFGGDGDMPDKPPIKTLTFRIITEQSAQAAALEAGDVDFIGSPPAGKFKSYEENEKYGTGSRTAGGFDMFVYPMQEAADTPFQNRKVRLAVNALIPREAIVNTVYNGIGIPAYAPISPLAAAFTSEEFQQEMKEKYA